MDRLQIDHIIKYQAVPDTPDTIQLMETHISWILLSKHYAFKIKKPVQFSFLDFSTLQKRHFFCKRELMLNQRLAKNIYLEVLAITENKGKPMISGNGKVIDYCVKMKRMNNQNRMDVLIKKDKITKNHILQIAKILAQFHQLTAVIDNPDIVEELQNDFADILNNESAIINLLGKETFDVVLHAVDFTDKFLSIYSARILDRMHQGFIRDGHGDLHSANIFIESQPIIFDCIEFNDRFRQIDVLNELAFLCTDLEFYNKTELSNYFLNSYLQQYHCMLTKEDKLLWLFYKMYRANIKIKINIIKTVQQSNTILTEERIQIAQRYFDLFSKYFKRINSYSSNPEVNPK